MSSHQFPISDTDWVGPPNLPPSTPNTFRLLFININSIGTHNYQDNARQLIAHQQTHHIDYLGLTEHCLNIHQPRVKSELYNALNRDYLGKFSLQIHSGSMTTKNPYLPGGTASLLLGPSIGRVERTDTGGDAMGRWSYFTLRRSGLPPLVIYTVYQVNRQPTNELGITAWHQQRLHLNRLGQSSTHPRTAFTTDLIAHIAKFQALGYSIIFGGDMNDTLTEPRSNLQKIMTSTGLIDPWLQLYPDLDQFSTYQRGSKRIDAVFCSPSLVSCIAHIGYPPYQWFTNCDHRGILLDFHSDLLFGGTVLSPLSSPNLRACKSNDPHNVGIFITQLHKHLTANNAPALLQLLETDTATPADVELLDKLIGQGGDSAEQHCRRRRPTYYSTKLAKLRAATTLALGNRNALRNNRPQHLTFQSRADLHDLDLTIATNLIDATHQYNDLRSQLAESTKTSRDMRTAEQNMQIQDAIDRGKHTKASYLKMIGKKEAQRRTWQSLRFARQQNTTQSTLDRLDIPLSWPSPTPSPPSMHTLENPVTAQHWKTITNPSDIEFYLKLRNQAHFGQAQGTPLTIPPFQTSLDWLGSSTAAQNILAGTHPSLPYLEQPQCSHLLTHCKRLTDTALIKPDISITDFEGKIKSWRELTSTSPSGRHLGRYKALLARGPFEKPDPPDPDSEYNQFLRAQGFVLSSIVAIINFCIRHNYVLTRWHTVVNTMIFKTAGNYRINRLRVIHIYEADFNLLLAVKWRQLTQVVETRQLLNQGLFGSRPGHEATSLTFLEELKYDIAYTSRRILFNFDNDAASCYDRILVPLASIINQKYGMHPNIVHLHANTLEHVNFHLRTQDGFSTSSYSHSSHQPIYGTGQGSGNSPCIWLLISSTMCDAHQQVSTGATFTSPDGVLTTHLTMVGFVDDCTGTCNDFRPQSQSSLHEIANSMAFDAQAWNDLLWCSGGQLELPKCSFHVLQFAFAPDGRPTPISSPPDCNITLIDSATGHPVRIQPNATTDPHKTLGHWKAPADPSQTKQLAALLSKAQSNASLIVTAHLSRYGTTLAYHGIYLAALKYVLPQCFFDPKHLAATERKTIQPILAKCGYNRNTALALRYAPLSYAGCGFVRWYTLQGEGQIALFLKHWRTNTLVSQTLKIAFAWSQWQSGLSQSIFLDTRTPLPHLESRWIKSTRQYLRHINAVIHIADPPIVPPERQGDKYIMEVAIRCKAFTAKDLHILNCCRIYLHVTTISELLTPSTTEILPHMYQCSRPLWWDTHKHITLQQRPSHYQIRTKWQPLCEIIRIYNSRNTHVHPQHWLPLGLPFRPRRESYATDHSYTCIYHWHNDCYYQLSTPVSTAPYTPKTATLSHPTQWIPIATSIPVSVSPFTTAPSTLNPLNHPAAPTFLIHIPILHFQPPPLPYPLDHHNDFDDYVQRLPTWEKELLTHTQFEIGPFSAMQSILSASHPQTAFYEVSDGSMKYGTTSFGWYIGTKTECLAWGSGPGFGPATSHRAECWGKLSAALFLKHLPLFTGLALPKRMKILSYSDNKAMITSLQKRRKYATVYANATLQSDWDILEQIHHTYAELPTKFVHFAWVKGHQDTNTAYEELPPEAQYNIEADLLAGDYIENNQSVRPTSPLLPAAGCLLQIRNDTIHGNYSRTIRLADSLRDLHGYLKSRYNWSHATLHNVNWTWFTSAANNYTTNTDNHLMKLVYDKLPTAAHKHHTGGQSWTVPICRHCNVDRATFQHLLRCDHEHGKKFCSSLPKAVRSYCIKKKIPHNFISSLVIAIEDWLRYLPPLGSRTRSPHLTTTIQAQHRIGWDQFFRGHLTTDWQRYLEYEFDHNRSASPPGSFDYTQFFSGLIRTIWTKQSIFWTDYQTALHAREANTRTPTETITQYRLEVKHLYSLRDRVQHHHRTVYFPASIRDFLHHSSASHLLNYITNYTEPIRLSIKTELSNRHNHKRLHTFPGFTRIRSRLPTTATTHSTTPLTPASQPPCNHSPPSPVRPRPSTIITPTSRLERHPHKHSRWRPSPTDSTRFLSFFHKPKVRPIYPSTDDPL